MKDKKLKILLLEDSESDAGLVIRALKKANINFTAMQVDSRSEFEEALGTYVPDLILSDHSLPDFNSLEAFKIFKSKNLSIPFILVTGTVSEEFAVNSLHQGIDDYILKDNLTRLPSSIENALRKRALETEKQKLEAEQLGYIEQLKKQNEELTKVNKELDRLVYSASHELKSPLKSILGLIKLTELELEEKHFDSFSEYLKLMERSVSKLSNTVEEIIYYSINNRVEIGRDPVDIEELIQIVWSKLSYLEGIDEVEKIVNINQSYPWYSDENRLVIILDNLIGNAVKYRNNVNRKSFVKLNVDVSPEMVIIEIEDNGIGIPSAYLGKIFDMFFRASSLSDGAGLGLYIAKETVAKLEGTIHVTSIVNEGTCFKVELPNYFYKLS